MTESENMFGFGGDFLVVVVCFSVIHLLLRTLLVFLRFFVPSSIGFSWGWGGMLWKCSIGKQIPPMPLPSLPGKVKHTSKQNNSILNNSFQ